MSERVAEIGKLQFEMANCSTHEGREMLALLIEEFTNMSDDQFVVEFEEMNRERGE